MTLRITRRMALAVAAVGLWSAPSLALAQAWPSRPVTVILPFAAGGGTDLLARSLAQHFSDTFGQQFVIDNRAGAGGNVGAAMVARAAKDGNTLLVGTVSTHAINPFIYKNLQHDTEKDFQPVSLIARLPNMLVVNLKLPAKNVAELVEHLKKNEGKLSYGSSGAGTSTHLAAELFQLKTGTKMTHVPFRSSGDVMNALVGGHIDLAFDNITLAWPQVKAGTMRALAVTSTQPSATAPEVPPIAATLPGFEATSWHGLFAPAGTPRPIVEALAGEVKRIFEQSDVQKTLSEVGAVPSPMTPEEFTRFITTERTKWQDVVKAAGVEVQ